MMKYAGFLLDMDGVLYRGPETIESAVDAVNALKSKGKKVFFMTNNSTRLPSEYQTKLKQIGVNSVKQEEIITSGTVTANRLAEFLKKEPDKRKALCVTEKAVKILLEQVGMEVLPDDVYKTVDYVVVGEAEFDRQRLFYPVNAIKHYGARFIGTNPDVTDPAPNNETKPVAGAIIAYIEACTGAKAQIMGKPLPAMYQDALNAMKLSSQEVLVIGDRLDTDVKGALDLSIDAALVETGSHKSQDIETLGIHPTLVLKELTELL